MKPTAAQMIRTIIEEYTNTGIAPSVPELLELERIVIRREGRYQGMMIGRSYSPVENDELTATKAHLEDMRRIVFEDKQS